MELLQLIVNVLTLIVMLVGLPYCLYAWFRVAVAMFRFQRSYKPEISFLRRCAPYNVFDEEAAAKFLTEEGLAFHLDGLILPDDGVADFEVEGFILPGVHA